ncbi:hypothetical protein BDY21DRAFT_84068 [Lineolata rhizophorae]|uniref:Uncharacterized protein n=1 Tax=Lineolata rhizophorae TaxID=578093 RepID=A0A6A6PC64_9PEZI|nr:hypothetical protein BDY21DRAFT_84068 [Lineolata rhizophorae]
MVVMPVRELFTHSLIQPLEGSTSRSSPPSYPSNQPSSSHSPSSSALSSLSVSSASTSNAILPVMPPCSECIIQPISPTCLTHPEAASISSEFSGAITLTTEILHVLATFWDDAPPDITTSTESVQITRSNDSKVTETVTNFTWTYNGAALTWPTNYVQLGDFHVRYDCSSATDITVESNLAPAELIIPANYPILTDALQFLHTGGYLEGAVNASDCWAPYEAIGSFGERSPTRLERSYPWIPLEQLSPRIPYSNATNATSGAVLEPSRASSIAGDPQVHTTAAVLTNTVSLHAAVHSGNKYRVSSDDDGGGGGGGTHRSSNAGLEPVVSAPRAHASNSTSTSSRISTVPRMTNILAPSASNLGNRDGSGSSPDAQNQLVTPSGDGRPNGDQPVVISTGPDGVVGGGSVTLSLEQRTTIDVRTTPLPSNGGADIDNGNTVVIVSSVAAGSRPGVLTFDSQTIIATNDGVFVAAPSTTLPPGTSPATASGKILSIGPSGTVAIIDEATRTQLGTFAVMIDGDAAADMTQFIVEPGTTLTPGGILTVSGMTYSFPESASVVVVINGETSTVGGGPIISAPKLTLDGATYTATASGTATWYEVVPGVTLPPGGPAVTVDGMTYSLRSSALVVVINGSTSIPSPAAMPATTAAEVGDYITSGLQADDASSAGESIECWLVALLGFVAWV